MWPKSDRVRVALKQPHPQQQKFIDSPAKRIIVRAGRRGGKTVGCAIRAVREFLEGKRVLYTAPVFEQTEAFWREITRTLGDACAAGRFTRNDSQQTIEGAGKQRIKATTSWSADTLRSDFADLLIIDEWQLCGEDLWESVGAPLLLDTDGTAIFIYTPPSLHSTSVSKARDPRHAAKMFKLAEADSSGRWACFHFTSHDNPHISRHALGDIIKDMTVLAHRQEILAEDVDEVQGALWQQRVIDETRVAAAPSLQRVVVGVDPSGSSRATADECGIVVAGIAASGEGYVLEDLSLRSSPEVWASVAVRAYHRHRADRIVAETNFGAAMVELTLRTVDESVSYRPVVASRGKLIRAEPVSALYEKGRVHHVGHFEQLEGELMSYCGDGASPNRLDSLVFALSDLMLSNHTLGLIDYFCSGQAERDLLALDTAPARVTRPAPEKADPAPACPACGSVCVIRASVPGGLHCNMCSHDFGSAKALVSYAGFVGGQPRIFRR
jgi:hypothetical protein